MLNYSTTDLELFLGKAENKLVILGEELISQLAYGEVEDCLLDKILLLSSIIDVINDSIEQSEINVLVYFALDYFNLSEIAYSPFSILPTTVITNGSGGGVSNWSDLLGKPSSFPASPHTHLDNDILINLSGITEFRDRFNSSFIGNLEDLLKTLLIKYQTPSFATFTQDKGNSFEIGQAISGDINFSWSINSSSSVKNSSNSGSITISEVSPFTANLPFNLFGTTGVKRTLTTSYKKNIPGTLTFNINGIASDDTSMNSPSTSLTWYSRIWYGNSLATSVDAIIIAGNTFNSTLTNSRGITFTINGSGYKYVFIPDNINQESIKFIDPNSGFEIAMNTATNIEVTNPQGLVLAGKLYRTKNSLGSALTVNIQ